MWPGRAMSEGLVFLSMAVRIVAALSWAEMPVVVLCLASMETQNAVWKLEVLFSTISGISSSSSLSPVMERQISPLPWVAMKAIVLAVVFCAGTKRSPSFSRFSSSTIMSILPFFISSIALSIETIAIVPSPIQKPSS